MMYVRDLAVTEETPRGQSLILTVEMPLCHFCRKHFIDKRILGQHTAQDTLQFDYKTGPMIKSLRLGLTDAFDGSNACEECASKNVVTFNCAMCSSDRQSSEVYEHVGNAKICFTCYNTTPAAQWDINHDRIEAQHRYDFD